VYKDHVMRVANAPGEKIFPGELAKALQILRRRRESTMSAAATWS
jgi:hypothetical protein